MRDYAKISCSIWNSQKFGSLRSDDARLFYFYLHTCPHVNSVGCFILPPGYAATDLGWSVEHVIEALDTLCAASLVGWEQAENLVRITGFLKQDPLTNPSHAAGAVRIAMKLPMSRETSILFMELLDSKHVKDGEALREALDTLSTPSRHPEPEPEPEPEPDIGGGGGARGADLTFREKMLDAMGVKPHGIHGPNGKMLGTTADMESAKRWIDAGLTEDEVVSVIRETARGSPPSTFRYFDKAMARLVAAKTAPALPASTEPRREVHHGKPSPLSPDRLGPIIGAALRSARQVE